MKYSYIFLLGLLCVVVTSCCTTIKLAEKKEIPLLTENKLFKNIETGELDYNTLFVKRMDVSLEHKGGSNGFKASMKIQRDSFIQISVTAPLGIEVARVLLTLDSIKFADVYHKKYFMTDYEFFNEKYDVRLGYNCIQDILTNTFFNFESCSGLEKSKKYRLARTVEGYELSSLEERAPLLLPYLHQHLLWIPLPVGRIADQSKFSAKSIQNLCFFFFSCTIF